MKKWTSFILVLALVVCTLTGCNNNTEDRSGSIAAENSDYSVETSSTDASQTDFSQTDASQTDGEMFTERDFQTDYDESDSVTIWLNGDSVQASSDSVEISGTTVTITEEATYILTGTLDDGMIIVNAPDTAKLQLVLNGVNINSGTSAALYILEADKVFVTLADDSENTLSNGGTFVAIDENNIDSAVFSKQDFTLNGSGSLTVTSPAGHGIVCKDDLVITSGIYCVTSASHGLDANDSVRVTGETMITVDAGKDGIHVENSDDTSLGFVYVSGGSMKMEAEGDGISAGAYMQITDGDFDILAGGGSENGVKESSDSWGGFQGGRGPEQNVVSEDVSSSDSASMKGLKSESSLLISGGSFTLNSADDAVHSNASITINGGNFDIASGDDAFHADDSLTVTDGTINITESYEGLEALHLDIQGGEITLVASDDGLNAAGGTDSSGTTGGRDGMFGGGGGHGDMGGGMSSSNGSITISGGVVYITASGDGIDANGSLTISGGYTVVTGPTQGDTATLDYDTTAMITGGTFIGTGAVGMAQTFSGSEQGVIAVSVGNQSAGTEITLQDTNGKELLSSTPDMSFAVVILSSPDLVSGETYSLTVGTISSEVEAN